MGREVVTHQYDTRRHQYFNSIQFQGQGLLTLREAADLGYITLHTVPGRQYPQSITSFLMTDKGKDAQEPIDLSQEIDPTGTGWKITVEEALEKELIRPIMGEIMIGYAVV